MLRKSKKRSMSAWPLVETSSVPYQRVIRLSSSRLMWNMEAAIVTNATTSRLSINKAREGRIIIRRSNPAGDKPHSTLSQPRFLLTRSCLRFSRLHSTLAFSLSNIPISACFRLFSLTKAFPSLKTTASCLPFAFTFGHFPVPKPPLLFVFSLSPYI